MNMPTAARLPKLPNPAPTGSRVLFAVQSPAYFKVNNRTLPIKYFTRDAIFGPNLVFELVYWEANQYGTIRWQLKILRTVEREDSFVEIYGIEPGVQVLLRVSREAKVKRVLALIDAIESLGIDPVEVPPRYWNVVHNRLCANLEAPEYSLSRHLAYLRLLAVPR